VSARPAKDAYLVAETIRLRHDLPMVDTVTGVICELALVDRPTRMSSSGVIGWTGPTISSPNGTSVRKRSPVWDHTPPNPRRVRSSGYVVPKARGTGVSWRPVEAAATVSERRPSCSTSGASTMGARSVSGGGSGSALPVPAGGP
jgi:hypothetical protein